MHRWDAEGVVASPGPLPAVLATDGVPEFVEIMIGAGAAALPGSVTLTATDTGASWQVAGHGGPDARRAGSRSCGRPRPIWS